MSKLLVGNWGNEGELEVSDPTPERLRHVASWGQRMIWSAWPGDVLVLPVAPDPRFLGYATALAGFGAESLEIVVPPPGRKADVLTHDRVDDPGFVAGLRATVRERGIDRAEPHSLNGPMSRLIRRIGLDAGTPGFGFADQGGNDVLNSKVTFRALAAGTGVPVPEGIVTESFADAVEFLWELLGSGRPAIAKQDVCCGGMGNEVLTTAVGVEIIGARHHQIVTDRAALADHVAKRWSWYTGGGCDRAVFEEYVAGSPSIWGEVAITDESVTIYGYGKVRMRPVCEGVVIPVPPGDSRAATHRDFLTHLRALAETMRAMGYRGLANIDAIFTPGGRVLFNEINARYGGSTHLFAIGERVVGGDYLNDRVLLERRTCGYPAFDAAWRDLSASGLAYDPETRTGVIIPVYGINPDGTGGEACIVAADLDEAEQLELALRTLFPGRAAASARNDHDMKAPLIAGLAGQTAIG